jgi:ATP-binding cassette subfamily B protein
MHRPRGTLEKSKDFKGSMKRLFNSLNNFRYLLIFALVLAMISAILSIIAPNKLSDLTDTITLGLQVNLSNDIIQEINLNENISSADKLKSLEIFSSLENDDKNSILQKLDELPSSVYEIVKPSIDMSKVKSIALLLLIFYLTSAIFGYVQSFILSTVSNNYAKKL